MMFEYSLGVNPAVAKTVLFLPPENVRFQFPDFRMALKRWNSKSTFA
jgi:hypothetical protein